MNESLTALLCDVGLTRNEALALLCLLEAPEDGELTGYEVAARSGIPRSAVYTVLRRLEQAGAAFSNGANPARYLPTSPDRFVRDLRAASTTRFDRLASGLARLPRRADPEPVWVVSRYEGVLERAARMLEDAKSAVYLSAWPRELEALAEPLAAAGRRGLHAVLHAPVPLALPPEGFGTWGDDGSDTTRVSWAHKMLLIVDREQALIGGAEPGGDNQAVWTRNPSLVDVATNHIILDITLIAARQGRDCSEDVAGMMRTVVPPA
jgi:sugar-specific transcriptional regulator TrmB